MSAVKWRAREFNPSENQSGSHSWFAESVIAAEISNNDLAEKIQARCGVRYYEAQSVVAAVAEVIMEELLESSRITLTDGKGTKMVSFYPVVKGSITDADVLANQDKYPGKTVAEESMLTPNLLTWTVGATMGVKFSKNFALNKQAQKVKYVASDVAIPNDEEEPTSGNQGGTTPTTNGENNEP